MAIAAPKATWGVSSMVKVIVSYYTNGMLVSFIATTLGILTFLFIFWKRLKDDYASEIIFETSIYIFLGIAVSQLVSFKLFPEWFFWTSAVGAAVGLYLGTLRFRIRFYESLEATVIGLLPWLSLIFLKDSVIHSSLSSFLAFIGTLIIIFTFYYLDTHYRNFTWYRSGKVGFAGLSTLVIIFIARSAIALSKLSVLSSLSKYEIFVSGVAAVLSFILLYSLSRKV